MRCPKKITITLLLILILAFPKPAFATGGLPTTYPTPVQQGSIVSISIPVLTGSLILTGYTSPNAVVAFTKDGVVAGTATACPGGPISICTSSTAAGYFEKEFTGLYPSVYQFGIYANDTSSPNLSTPTVIRTIVILEGQPANTDALTLPPTIRVEKLSLKRPETQIVRGMARPNSQVKTLFNNDNQFSNDVTADIDGAWSITTIKPLHLGNNFVTAFVQGFTGAISETSRIINFLVEMSADLNIDTQVDISDFSMLMFNYGLETPPNWAADINDDTYVDLSDFSIMMYNWTGETGQLLATPTPSPFPSASPSPSPIATVSPSPSPSPSATPSTSPTP
jgi:hypothetical protein